MKTSLAAVFLSALLALSVPLRAQVGGIPAGIAVLRPAAVSAVFQGEGDIVSGSRGYWGVIAYNAAAKSTKALNLCNVADVACADVSYGANGLLSSTQVIGGITCGTSVGVNVCTVKIAYDKSGANNCSAAACDASQATISVRPTFLPNAVGTLPALKCSVGAPNYLDTAAFTGFSPPYSFTGAFDTATAAAGSSAIVFSNAGTGLLVANSSGSPVHKVDAGTQITTAATGSYNTFYSIIGDVNATNSGNASGISRNATRTAGNAGTSTTGTVFGLCGVNGSSTISGEFLTAGIWPTQFTGTQITNLTATMRANGGY